jgi:crotonobetainyl-CoA:carnitine CoA-transferase CaiB-like acyl-CoA transferase
MLCSNAYVVSDEFFDYDGKQPTAGHDDNGTGPLYRLYQANKGWVFLAAPLERDWDQLRRGLAAVTGADPLDDPRFETAAGRVEGGPQLAATLAAVFASRGASEWEQALVPLGVACVEVNEGSFSDFTINGRSMVDNGFVAEVEHPLFGRHRRHGPIVSLSGAPGTPGPGCLVGQHTRPILAELGYTDAQMSDLRARGVVAWPD